MFGLIDKMSKGKSMSTREVLSSSSSSAATALERDLRISLNIINYKF